MHVHACPCLPLYVPSLLQVAEAIASAVKRGLSIPIIYNTSSYDALSSLALMDGLVDIVSACLAGPSPPAAPSWCIPVAAQAVPCP